MQRIVLHRVAAMLLVLTFVVGAPLQGAAGPAPTDGAAIAALPMPDGCTDCADDPDLDATCPVAFCAGLAAIVFIDSPVLPTSSAGNGTPRHRALAGVARRPDPYPPRTESDS